MRRIDIHLPAGDRFDTALRVVKAADPIDYSVWDLERRDRRMITVFMRTGDGQSLIDSLQSCLEDRDDWRVVILSIEATVPTLPEPSPEKAERIEQATREEIVSDIAAGSRLDRDFVVMIALSVLVAAMGLNGDSAAVVIGAMVIAPLLSPIIGFALGAALGDFGLIRRAGLTLAAGVAVSLAAAVGISFVTPLNLDSHELRSRAEAGLDAVVLAIAAGAAAALSISRSQASGLVGVMVAAALIPAAAAAGLFLGHGQWALASRAGLLLALNVACLLLGALATFRLRDIRPRTTGERRNADRAVWVNLGATAVFVAAAVALILVLDLGAEISLE